MPAETPTTPSVAKEMEKTQSLTQVANSVSLYDQSLSLGLIMRPVRRVVDTTKLAEIAGRFAGAKDSVKNISNGNSGNPDQNSSTQEKKESSIPVGTAAIRTDQAVSKVGELLRSSLISEDATRNENRTQEEFGPLISMPLPEKIKDSLRVNYSSADLGMAAVGAVFGQDVANPMSDGASIANSLVGSASYVIRTLLAALPGGIGGLSQKLSGNIPNPFSAAIFEKVTPRKFSFNWTIQPQTPEESKNLKDVINHLRYWSLPNPSKQRLILEVPYEWELSFVGTGFLYSFSRCVMSNLDIDYSPNGFNAFMADGAPQAVTISVEFEEIFPLDKSTIDEAGIGATSMRPSGVLETRTDDNPISATDLKIAEQQGADAIAAAEFKLIQARDERIQAEKVIDDPTNLDLVEPDPRNPDFVFVAGIRVKKSVLENGAEGVAAGTRKVYESAYQNEVNAYNEYSSAIQQFETDTGKKPTKNVLLPPEPLKP